MDSSKQNHRAINFDPNTIQVGATAKRNSDGSLHLNNTFYNRTPMRAVPPQEFSQRMTSNILKQPHHKLPLKMLLSETARRGGDPIKASLPVSTQNFKPIEDLFQMPPESDWKKSRLELLTDPRHLAKKRDQSKRAGAKHFQYTNPFNSSTSLFETSFTTLEENPLPTNENVYKEPICPSQNLCDRKNMSVALQPMTSQLTISKKNNPCSTPHTLAKFQNLYGSSFKQPSNKIEIDRPINAPMETQFNIADVAEPISEMHAWCREKSFVTTPDNLTPIPQSPYYTNTRHDSRSLNKLLETPIAAEVNKENVPTPYFSQNFIETVREKRYSDLDEGYGGQAPMCKFTRARDVYANRAVTQNCASGFGNGTGTQHTTWEADDQDCHTPQGDQVFNPEFGSRQSRNADISFTVRKTEYSFSIDSQ